MDKIPFQMYQRFVEFNKDHNKGTRFGHAFILWINEEKDFFINDPELFYCKDTKECVRMIMERYVNKPENISNDETIISTVTLTVVLSIKHSKDVDVGDIVNELDYDFTSKELGVEVVSTDISDSVVDKEN
jgi:hypothetical protein